MSSKTNICINCKKACGGCPWSAKFEPVEGWDAEKVAYSGFKKMTETYHIKACPLFEPDDPRTNTTGEISDEEFRRMLEVWKWREEHGE